MLRSYLRKDLKKMKEQIIRLPRVRMIQHEIPAYLIAVIAIRPVWLRGRVVGDKVCER